jgi:putative tricarboxylic transport membrane protein
VRSSRRDFLTGGIAASAALALGLATTLPGCSRRSDGRTGALEVLVPSGPGGGWDQTARSMQRVLTEAALAANIRVNNVPGGGGAVGLARFLGEPGRAQALMVSGLVMVGALAVSRAPVRLIDATPIARLTGDYEVIAVHADSPYASMRALLDAFRADPARVSWAGGAAGGTDHILTGMIASAAGVDPAHVAYVAYAGGGQALAALLGNQVTCAVSGWSELAPQIASGALRALAISAPERIPGSAVPTLREAGLALDLANWRGVFGAPGISGEETDALVGLMRQMTATPGWRAELTRNGWTDLFLHGAEFASFLADETARVGDVLARAGLSRP